MKGLKAVWTVERQPSEEELRTLGKCLAEATILTLGKLQIYGYMLWLLEIKKKEAKMGIYCGLCQVKIKGNFEDHLRTKKHIKNITGPKVQEAILGSQKKITNGVKKIMEKMKEDEK